MTKFDPNTRYLYHSEGLEESLMSYTHGDIESWDDALSEFLAFWTNDDAQKALSELGLDTTELGAVDRLRNYYSDPAIRHAVIAAWHFTGHYLPE